MVAVRAGIRAIDKLELAQEVRDQKKQEASMLSEALLDAEVRLGELLKAIPTRSGGDRKSSNFKNDTAVAFEKTLPTGGASFRQDFKICTGEHFEKIMCTGEHNLLKGKTGRPDEPNLQPKLVEEKPKHEIINDLGFNQAQAQRFETLANNKDIVEQVKAEARENDDIPTRSRVLQIVQEQKKTPQEQYDADIKRIDYTKKIAKEYHDAIYKPALVRAIIADFDAWSEILASEHIPTYLEEIDCAISNLQKIKVFLTNERRKKQ